MLRTGYFAAAGSEVLARPVLVGSDEGGSTSTTLTVPCTVPDGCDLAVVVLTARAAGAARDVDVATLGGVDLLTEIAYEQNTNRPGSALYYLPYPTPGAQSLSITFSGSMNSNHAEVFYFIGNPEYPFQASAQDNSVTSGSYIEWAPTINDNTTVVVAGACKTNPTSSAAWTLTNLTESSVYDRRNEDSHVKAYNNTYDAPGVIAFGQQGDGSSSYLSGVWGQLNPIGYDPTVDRPVYISHEVSQQKSSSTFCEMSVTVPADATFMLVHWASRDSGGDPQFSLPGCYLDSAATPLEVAAPSDNISGRPTAGFLMYRSPTPGAHTVRVTLNESWFSTGQVMVVSYWKDVDLNDPIESYTGLIQNGNTKPLTQTLTAASRFNEFVGTYCDTWNNNSIPNGYVNLNQMHEIGISGGNTTIMMGWSSGAKVGPAEYGFNYSGGANYASTMFVELRAPPKP